MDKKFKKGFGTMLLMEMNKKAQEENILTQEGKVDLDKYQDVFNSFLRSNNLNPKKSSDSSRTNTTHKNISQRLNLDSKEFSSSDQMIKEIIVEIDGKIESKMKNLTRMASKNPQALESIIQKMLDSEAPEENALAVFLQNY